MDTRTVSDQEVADHLAEIKAHMPETYATIQREAAEQGKTVFGKVRAGLRGERNCFWAMERGFVKGTPFHMPEIQAEVALAMVRWGSANVCILGIPKKGGADGAH